MTERNEEVSVKDTNEEKIPPVKDVLSGINIGVPDTVNELKRIYFSNEREGYVQIRIRDEKVEITDEHFMKVFERFFKTTA